MVDRPISGIWVKFRRVQSQPSCWTRLWLCVKAYTKHNNCLTYKGWKLHGAAVILSSSSYLSQNYNKILWMHPQGPTQESGWRELSELLKVMRVWCAVFVQLVCVGVPGCALRALWLFGMITLAKFMYWLCLKLDADANMCNLLDPSSVHAYVWRPLDFRAPSQWNEANLVKSINTSLPVYIMKNLLVQR